MHLLDIGCVHLMDTCDRSLPNQDTLAELFSNDEGEWLHEITNCYIRAKSGYIEHAKSTPTSNENQQAGKGNIR